MPGVLFISEGDFDVAIVGFISTHAKEPEAANAHLSYLSSSEAAAATYKACAIAAGRGKFFDHRSVYPSALSVLNLLRRVDGADQNGIVESGGRS
jgi:hypothetical protein